MGIFRAWMPCARSSIATKRWHARCLHCSLNVIERATVATIFVEALRIFELYLTRVAGAIGAGERADVCYAPRTGAKNAGGQLFPDHLRRVSTSGFVSGKSD